ncbi:hypothetical protein K435DRAFT_811153, partial [Dendrothele bispora CBS 962.96]
MDAPWTHLGRTLDAFDACVQMWTHLDAHVDAKIWGPILQDVLTKTAKQRKSKPQRLTAVQVFQSKYYRDKIKSEADKDWEAARADYEQWRSSGDQSETRKPPVRVAINYAAAKRLLEQQDEEFRAEMQRLADQGYEE